MNSFAFNQKVVRYLFPFIGGLLFPLGFPIKGLPHFMGFTFIGLFLLLQATPLSYGEIKFEAPNLKSTLLSLLLFSLGYCFLGYYWIPYTLNEFGGIPFPINMLLGALFSFIIVPQYLIFVLIIHYWNKLNLKKSSLAGGPYTRNLLYAFILVLLENFVPQQFPAHLGHTWLQLAPYLGLSPYFGVPLFSFVSYWLIFGFVGLWRIKKFDFFSLVVFIFCLIFNFLSPLEYSKNQEKNLNIRLVQANVGNFMKLNSEDGGQSSMQEIYNRYHQLSTKESSVFKEPMDLIIWPETAYPQLLNSAMMRVSPAFIPSIVRKSVSETGAQLFFGGYDKSGQENKNYYETEYNAGFLINREGKLNDTYHKMLLIPFGESLPFGPLNPYFAGLIDNLAFFAKGEKYTLFQLDGGQTFISAVCYEILFSGFIRKYLNQNKQQADFIVNLTNDSWYGDTSEPYQHQYLAFWRALEFQIPIVRMTNTGVTSVLYPDGAESKRLPLFKKDILDLTLALKDREASFYQRFGLWPVTTLFLLVFGFSWFYERFKKS